MQPLLLSLALLASADLYDIQVRKLVDGVYVASRADPLRPYVEGNSTVIVNEHDVVVVDAGGSPRIARNTIAEIRKLTPNPVRYVVLTHIHRDHRFGLQEYLTAFPGVEVIAHPAVRQVVEGPNGRDFVAGRIKRLEDNRAEVPKDVQALRAEGKPGHEKIVAVLERYAADVPVLIEEYRTVRNLGPTATFEQKLTLHRGARAIDILFLGRGDTDHDIVVHLPREKIVVTGDMVVHPFPFGSSPHPSEWIATLGRLAALDFEQLIPGHGDVQQGKAHVRRTIDLVQSVRTQVRAARAAGLDLEATRAKVDLAPFEREVLGDDPVARYFFRQNFTEPAVAAAFKEAAE
ncbi:MAG TPA: MBL fold metallo-hydrolase [Thermoanaerobaculia bacterium]|jgi:glyoxylase-like metal-dependent hydrolase (beta-lactamase superfamily II)